MIERPFWLEKLRAAWRTRPIVWLSGVRRAGKTCLARLQPDALLMNCDLPSVQQRLADVESFFAAQRDGQIIIFDEIHRLPDPSSVLKIAADAFPALRILATGSSTLAATRKFRDSLTGRKWSVYLCPVLWDECRAAFKVRDLDTRLLHGGLPEPLLAPAKDPAFFAEWLDSYYARDIAELFNVRDRTGFMSLLRLLLAQSGGLADYTKLASESGLSRHTVKAHIEAMSIAHAIFLVRPFHGGGRREITHRPKLYAFDTGFVSYARGWDVIREEDRGVLWEHLVLDSLRAAGLEPAISYWRDKSGRELDFVLARGATRVDVVECKINPERFTPDILTYFRGLYPHGNNYLVCPAVNEAYTRRMQGHAVTIMNTAHLAKTLQPHPRPA